MLKVTRELIDGIRAAQPGSFAAHILADARVAIVARHGTEEDADALLDLFLEAPTESRRECVLDAITRVGKTDTAKRMASACLAGGELKEGVRESVLRALGFLGFAEARDVLWKYAQNRSDHSLQQNASLGLMNLSCEGLEREIETAIRACVGESLFAEFLPVLAHKIGNPELLDVIFDLGRTTASTDCNSGIVYGIALFGVAGRPHFYQLLFDQRWEAYGGGTGTQWWAHHGFRHLGGSFTALTQQVRQSHSAMSQDDWEYRVRVWQELTKCWMSDSLPLKRGVYYASEPVADIYHAAFDWSSANGDDSFTGLLRLNSSELPLLYELRERLSDRITAEVLRQAGPEVAVE